MSPRYFKSIFSQGTPLLIGLVAEHLLVMADAIMVGQLGVEHLAAIAIGILFAEILWETVIPMSAGTQSIASRRYGKEITTADSDTRDRFAQNIGDVLDNAILVSLIIGVCALIFAHYSHPLILLMFGNQTTTVLAESYIQIIKWDIPVFAVLNALIGFFGAINRTVIIMVVVVEINILNIFITYLLVFGELGFPALGIEGAAWGTVISSIIGLIHLLAYVLYSREIKIYKCLRFRNIQYQLTKDIVKITSPIVLLEVFSLSVYFIYESFIIKMGAVFLAVTHIIITVLELNKVIIRGYAKSASIFIGNALGRSDKKEAYAFAKSAVIIAFLIGSGSFTVFIFFPEYLIRAFNGDKETLVVGVEALRFFAIFALFEGIGYSMETIFTHNGWGRYALISEFTTNIIFLIGVTFLLAVVFDQGVWGAWVAFALYIFTHAAILIGGFLSKRWLNVTVENL